MKFKRFFILFICVLMVTAMMPLSAIADDQAKGGGSHFLRIAGKNRYDTSMFIAHEWLNYNSGYSFDNVILASGTDFPDALGSSGPANETFAPIILVDNKNLTGIAEYVKTNLASGGYVYIMGGNGAVPSAMETELVKAGIISSRIKRFSGRDRYETNLKVLKNFDYRHGVFDGIVVCSGKNYADALSASALGSPILLVGDTLTDAQKKFLVDFGFNRFLIVGGIGAVSQEVYDQLTDVIIAVQGEGGWLYRVGGKDRYETSRELAFFGWDSSDTVVLTYGNNFPDGLCGCTMCFWEDAPLLLASTSAKEPAAYAAQCLDADFAIVLGGESLISDEAVEYILGVSK
jgi:putative cell wall-binding protein